MLFLLRVDTNHCDIDFFKSIEAIVFIFVLILFPAFMYVLEGYVSFDVSMSRFVQRLAFRL